MQNICVLARCYEEFQFFAAVAAQEQVKISFFTRSTGKGKTSTFQQFPAKCKKMSWCTIESDPGVFTALIEDIGVKGVQVEELYSLDEENFQQLKPVYGLVFLFKWQSGANADSSSAAGANTPIPEDLFFAKQVITNACATQALLAILLNSPDIELGDTLSEFKSFTAEFPSDLKGLAISNSDKIRVAHNSFSHPSPFVMDESVPATDKDDVYHFVAYVPFRGHVYELDGLKEQPIPLGSFTGDDWIAVVRPAIQKRIETYASSEIRFNLLGLIQNRKQVAQNRLSQLMEMEQTSARVQDIAALKATIAAEDDKFNEWKKENLRRKHNYVPFLVQLLKMMEKKGKLQPLIDAQATAPSGSA